MLVYIKPLSMFPKLHSDTLFGALTSAISELFPDKVDEMLTEFKINNPQFLISSTFPFIFNSENKIRFYPKIILNTKSEKIENIDFLKEYKKVDYLEETIFFDILSHKLTENEIINNFSDYHKVGNLLMNNDYGINVSFETSILPNNSINRLTNETETIFYSEGIEYGNMGLFFLIDVLNDEYEDIIQSALKFLKDRGLGRDISTGKGQFDFEIEDISIDDLYKNTGDKFITLSRFIPSEDDLEAIIADCNYELDSKRGRDKSGEIRKQIRFFKEGSTFRNSKDVYGKLVEVGINMPAIEYGYAYPVKYSEEIKWAILKNTILT